MIRTRLQGATPFFPNMLNNGKVEVCLKEDVDKALAEKDKVIAELKEKLKNSRNARKYWMKEYLLEHKECIHHKYKRCLAMALLALEKRESYKAEYEEWCLKWYKRWLELAEKFEEKEGKQ